MAQESNKNVYYQARLKASEYDDSLKSRGTAAPQLGISTDSLKHYELGLCKVVPNDVVVLMAERYNAPELMNWYCMNECPIGQITGQSLEIKPLERISLQLIRATNNIGDVRDTLADIAADGVIDDDEQPKLKEILSFLGELKTNISEIELYCRKNRLLEVVPCKEHAGGKGRK